MSEIENYEELILPFKNDKIGKPKFIFERLYFNNELIVDRNEEKIIYNNNPLPKLDTNTSILKLLEEDNLKNVVKAFDKIITRDYTQTENIIELHSENYDKNIKNKFKTIERLKQRYIPIIPKIYISSIIFPDIFNEIKNNLLENTRSILFLSL